MAEQLWDNETAARYLRCSPGTLRVWASRKEVPFFRVRRLVRFRKEDLDRWLEKNRVEVAR